MRKALVVGINDYPGSQLNCCINDANCVTKLLEKHEDGSPNFDVKKSTAPLTKGMLRKMIVDLFHGQNDVALLYFSGHGFAGQNGDSYLVTSDYQTHDWGVSLDWILELANNSQTQNKIIILDSCFSGSMGSPSFFGRNTAMIGEGVTVLSSSLKDEESIECNGHGLFTTFFLEALKGCAADVTGNITLGSIYSYIDKSLGPWDQRPVFKTNVSRFLSIRNVNPTVPLECIRKLTKYFSTADTYFKLDPSFEYTNTPSETHSLVKPYADVRNVKIFKDLQKMESVGLVQPVGEDHMYFAAMKSKECRLTPLGWHYWNLVKKNKI